MINSNLDYCVFPIIVPTMFSSPTATSSSTSDCDGMLLYIILLHLFYISLPCHNADNWTLGVALSIVLSLVAGTIALIIIIICFAVYKRHVHRLVRRKSVQGKINKHCSASNAGNLCIFFLLLQSIIHRVKTHNSFLYSERRNY